MAAIELEGLRKEFGPVTALRDVDLTVEDGEIFGFLGPNGAGKSTTIAIMLDLVRPTAGTARVLGHDPQSESRRLRERVGFLSDAFEVYDRLTGRQHLTFAIDSKDTGDDPEDLLDRVDLADAVDRKAGGYSTGMKQRLGLATTLVGDPDLLILDEPSTGLDPNGAHDMREVIRAERDRGATVFFSSHIMGQVEAVCDRVGILRDGELVAQDTVEGLREAVGGGSTLRVRVDSITDGTETSVRETPGVSSVTVEDGPVLVVGCDDDAKRDVIGAIESAGGTVEDFETTKTSLDELFAAYTETDGGRPG